MSDVKLFPLRSTILPEGRMQLRIFEPRYVRMVSDCLQSASGFGVCLIDDIKGAVPHNISQRGTYVSIIDFDSDDDNTLIITVSGVKKFSVASVHASADGLRNADVQWIDNWQHKDLSEPEIYLSEYLQEVYSRFPQIGGLYPHRFFDDASWVCQRWLEILPIDCDQFEKLVSHGDCSMAIRYLDNAFKSGSLRLTTS
jgi:Lon protease-like protein